MTYTKTQWLDKNDPLFDAATSPEIDADALNKIEQGISDAMSSNYTPYDNLSVDAIDNLYTARAVIESTVPQGISITRTDFDWNTVTQSTDESMVTFNDTLNTFTILKSGTYNLKTITTFGKTTDTNLLMTCEVIDSVNSEVWNTSSTALPFLSGETLDVYSNKQLVFTSSDLPKTLKIVHSCDGAGATIDSSNYVFGTFTEKIDIIHNELNNRDAQDCHTIDSITGLSSELSGTLLAGEEI